MSDGTEFVVAGYGLTVIVVALYVMRVWRGLVRARDRLEVLEAEARARSRPGPSERSPAQRAAAPVPPEPVGAGGARNGEVTDG